MPGQHWAEVAAERIRAGESEEDVLEDYGYRRTEQGGDAKLRAEIKEIADYALRLEEHYQKPQDIEFAIEERKVYIVQSRPITTLEKKTTAGEISGNVILEGQSASPGIGTGTVKIIHDMEDIIRDLENS